MDGPKALAEAMEQIRELYDSIDEAYVRAARSYPFTCSGCDQNCCGERFHHHTIIEEACLAEGLKTLGDDRRRAVLRRAQEVCADMKRLDALGEEALLLCPLNEGGRCTLYPFRPMICRLHGIPSLIAGPGVPGRMSDGCHKFDRDAAEGRWTDVPFDRTGFYRTMAAIEIDLRRALAAGGKTSKTVAGMIVDILDPDGERTGQ